MAFKVFVDGQAGTTGLEISERLGKRHDLEVLAIDPERRKDPTEKAKIMNQADVVFLCLPDQASREAAALVTNAATRVIDASTAFRTDPAWAYGIPELSPVHRRRIRKASRVANPGCHATGFNVAVYPLVKGGIIPAGYPLTCQSLTGYSGGGKAMIADYQGHDSEKYRVPRPYALGLEHKHLPEMQAVCGLVRPPVFVPVVGDFYRGMAVMVPLHAEFLAQPTSAREIHAFLANHYRNEHFVRVMPFGIRADLDGGLFFDATGANGTNRLDLFVFGTADRTLLVARLDNLGKGASGAAIQNMNILLGLDEDAGLQ